MLKSNFYSLQIIKLAFSEFAHFFKDCQEFYLSCDYLVEVFNFTSKNVFNAIYISCQTFNYQFIINLFSNCYNT